MDMIQFVFRSVLVHRYDYHYALETMWAIILAYFVDDFCLSSPFFVEDVLVRIQSIMLYVGACDYVTCREFAVQRIRRVDEFM